MSTHHPHRQQHDEDEQTHSQVDPAGYGLGLQGFSNNVALAPSSYNGEFHGNDYPQTFEGLTYPPNPVDQGSSQPASTPRITGFNPRAGSFGDQVTVSIRCNQHFLSSPGLSLAVVFNSILCPTSVQPLPSSVGEFQYNLYFQVPRISDSGAEEQTNCPLQLCLQDQRGRSLWVIPFGTFIVNERESTASVSPSSTRAPSNRRLPSRVQKTSGEPQRRSTYESQRQDQSHEMPTGPAAYSSQFSEQAASGKSLPRYPNQTYGPVSAEQRSFSDRQSSSIPSPRSMSEDNQLEDPHQSFPHTTSQQQASPSTPGGSYDRSPSAAPPQQSGPNPQLVRTSTLNSATAAANFSASPSSSSQPFNPYAIYPNKAFLKIEGDLDAMAEGWTEEEKETRRRLVEFKRKQSGNNITTTFRPVTLEQRAPNSICVSCIWWEEKEGAYVTSVDTIQLLESLVGVRFTVEEKNRIRRNLEGFRPMTVAKGKSDSEKFFKTIMDFPNPKPRNIEKDVKVFPWEILSQALKKIIGKYSASYASTASSLHPASALEYPQACGPNEASRLSVSPTSVASSATSASQGPSSAPHTTSPFLPAQAAGGEHQSMYPRQASFPPYATPMGTPQPTQYMTYGPVEYSWPQQEQAQAHEMYGQGQQYQSVGAWHYGLENSPVVTSPPQFGPVQPVNLPLQQRRASQAAEPQHSYGQYPQPRSQPP